MRLAFSPCPNDTFIFYAWAHGLIAEAPAVEVVLADIDELNAMALRGEADVTKLSFAALAHVLDRYALLHAGGALGRGCGPLLVVGEEAPWRRPEELVAANIAIPGELTTAALLLRLRLPGARHLVVMRFDEVMPDEGDVDMVRAARTYQEVGYQGVLDPDHVPASTLDSPWGHRARAYCLGYIQGVLQALGAAG